MFDEIKTYYLRSMPIFSNLTKDHINELAAAARFKQVTRSEIVRYGSKELSKIFLLIKGKIKLTSLDDESNELVKDILTDGEIFGDIELDGNFPEDELAEVLTANAMICSFYVSDFRKLMESISILSLNYARKVSSKLKRLENRHADLVFRDAKARLIRFIKDWAKMDGNRVDGKIVLINYLTHTDIANFISTSRQSVNVLFNELRDSGFLFYDRKRIELNDSCIWN